MANDGGEGAKAGYEYGEEAGAGSSGLGGTARCLKIPYLPGVTSRLVGDCAVPPGSAVVRP